MFYSKFKYFLNLYRAICVGRYQYLFKSLQGCTIIYIGCVRSADTNNNFCYRLITPDIKMTSFFISFKWYQPGEPISKMTYQPIPNTFCVGTKICLIAATRSTLIVFQHVL
jgi:hypothetical protein